MKLETAPAGVSLCIACEWRPVLGEGGEFHEYPRPLPRGHHCARLAAVYRWNVFDTQPGDLMICYVGEAQRLGRRVAHYVNPGPTQETNLRLSRVFREHIEDGHHIGLDLLIITEGSIDGRDLQMADLADGHLRRAVEQIVTWQHLRDGWTLLNAQ